MTTQTWHAREGDLAAYASGSVSPASAASIEAHLLACAACRGVVATHVDRAPLAAVWDRVAEEVLAPPRSVTERALRRLGLRERDAVVAGTAPRVRGAWVLGVLLCLVLVLAAVSLTTDRVSLLYLQLAPLLPVAAVALSYGQESDPMWETTLATPYPALRLLLLRSLAVLAAAAPVAAVGGWLIPGPTWVAGAWLLPAFACVALTLALATWLPLWHAAGGVAVAWATITLLASSPFTSGRPQVWSLLMGGAVPVYLLVALGAALVFWRRADRISYLGRNA